MDFSPGTVLAGKYAVVRQLGQGGMGVVLEARHLELDERVAMKFLRREYAGHPEAAQRFTREARAAVKIKSEHVARVLDVGKLEGGEPYMVMELLEGEDLSARLKRAGRLDPETAIDFVLQACEALAEAHSYGIVHRDLKPANLFESKRPDGTAIVKVLDFGISKVMADDSGSLTGTGATMGSAYYMSPEQMESTRSVDARADVYSMGVTLFELMAGRPPFLADTYPAICAMVLMGKPASLRVLRPDLDEGLERVVMRAFARETSDRFASIGELAVALAPFAGEQSRASLARIDRLSGGTPRLGDSGASSREPSADAPSSEPIAFQETEMEPSSTPPPRQGGKGALVGASTDGPLSTTTPPIRASRTPFVAGAALLFTLLAVAVFSFSRARYSDPTPPASGAGIALSVTATALPKLTPSPTLAPSESAEQVSHSFSASTPPPAGAPVISPEKPSAIGGHPIAKPTAAPTATPSAASHVWDRN